MDAERFVPDHRIPIDQTLANQDGANARPSLACDTGNNQTPHLRIDVEHRSRVGVVDEARGVERRERDSSNARFVLAPTRPIDRKGRTPQDRHCLRRRDKSGAARAADQALEAPGGAKPDLCGRAFGPECLSENRFYRPALVR